MGDRPTPMMFLNPKIFVHKISKNRCKILVKTRIEPSCCYGPSLCGYAIQLPLKSKATLSNVDAIINKKDYGNNPLIKKYANTLSFDNFFTQKYPHDIRYNKQIIIKNNLDYWSSREFKDLLIHFDHYGNKPILCNFFQYWQGGLMTDDIIIDVNQPVNNKTRSDLIQFLNKSGDDRCGREDFDDLCRQLSIE